MATNIDIQQQLNALLEQQSKLMEEQTKSMRDQISLSRELVSSLSRINYRGIAEDVNQTQSAIEKAQESTSKFGGESQTVFQKVTSSIEEAVDNLFGFNEQTLKTIEKVGKLSFIAGSAMTGFVSGLKFSGNLMKNVISLGGGMLDFMGNLAASIISIPFKMLSGLISMADTGGDNQLAQALEDIRKEFGALHATAGKAIIDMARAMKGELANTGLSVYRIMGNLADRLKTIAEWAKQLGPLFENLAPSLIKNSEAFAAYNKGLGLTDNGLKAVGTRAYATGQDITEIQRQMANYSVQLGKSFGLSSKMISRDMGDMMADFKHFGSLAPQILAQVSVYARKLGIDIKALTGVIDKFDNFEDAAQGAAHLSQAFGLNVDALELMKAQDPAQRLEMIRKAFFQAGRSVETMTRQERALLAQQTGLTDDSLDLVFSLKNQGLSYADIQKKGDGARKKQLSQAEAMKALADSIERLVKSGSAGAGGFFDRFIQGFASGIRQSRDFRMLMVDIRRILQTVFYHGMQVGRMFVQMFPGVQNILQGLRGIFNPTRWRALMDEVVGSFRDFFRDLTDNPQTALPRLLDRLKRAFFNFFDSRTEAGHRLLDGFRTFFKALSVIAGGLLKVALQGITTGIRFIVDLISGRKSLNTAGIAAGGAGALGFLGEILSPIIDALKDAIPPLWNAIKDLFIEVFHKVSPWLIRQAPLLLGVLFGPAVLGMVGRTATSAIITMLLSSIGRAVTSGGFLSRGGGLLGGAFQRLTGAASRTAEAAHGVGGGGIGGAGRVATGAIGAANEAAQAAERSRISPATMAKLALITLVIGVGMYLLVTKGLVPLAKSIQDQHITGESIRSASLTMIAAAGAMTAMAGALALLNLATRGLNPGMAGRMAAGVAIIGLVAAGMAWEGKQIIDYLKDIRLNDLAMASIAMGAIGAFFIAAALATGGAALVGAIAVAGGGLGALAIAAGLTAIVATIEVMAREGMRILRIIDEFRPAPGFIDKAKAFGIIMEAVGTFAGNIARIIEASRPSFLSFLHRNHAEEQRKNHKAVQSVVRTIGDGIIDIINTIRPFVTQLAGAESQLKAAEALGNLLNGVGNLAKALAPPMEQLTNHTSVLWGFIDDSEPSQAGLIGFGTAIIRMQTALRDIIEVVRGAWNVVTAGIGSDAVVKQQVDLANAFAGILGAVGTMAHALRPDASTAARLSESRDIGRVATVIGSVVEGIIDAITHSHIISNVARLVLLFLQSIEEANFSDRTVRILQAALPAVTSIFSAVGSIATTLGSIVTATSGAHANPGAINEATIFVSTLLDSLAGRLPQIVDSMVGAFGSLTPEIARTVDAAAKAFQTVVTAVTTIMNTNIPTGGDITTKFNNLATSMAQIQVGVEGLTWNLVHSSLLGPDVETLVRRIREAHIDRVGGAIHDMVQQINLTSTALRNLSDVNINTQLQRVADNLGLGANGTYRIENRNFTIQVNLNVKFDNNGLDAFELAMINRTGPTPTRLNTTRRTP